ncbi:semaphorin-4F isoform X2 [Syngnathus acus]|uniref:semaphorin-4F isoform X2 n=1 Tax=Syngnathus acus TaxID=161584 RepID=UPI00188602BE|nr:semaphorin-4F isoform X2 [Syngnathus acus]
MTSAGVMFACLPVCCLLLGTSRAATLSGLQYPVLSRREFGAVANFSTLLLDPASGLLFLGARDTIVALDTNKLNEPVRTVVWDVPQESRKTCMAKGKTEGECHNYIVLLEFHSDGRHIYACGTHAFDPKCAYLEISSLTLRRDADGHVIVEMGRKKVPFDPRKRHTAVMIGDVLYAATSINFRGTEFDITRATGPEQKQVRSEQKVHWLDEPDFVSSAAVALSADNNETGEDDRIYFFFNEAAQEYNFYSKVRVPRVARVCRSDVGGLRTLQQHWTTFLKAELVCEDKVRHRRFDVLVDVFTLRHSPGEAGTTHFYGLFTTQWEPERSAVCVFSMSDIVTAMNGPFRKGSDKSDALAPAGLPRPGQCVNNALKAHGFDSSLKMPDNLLAYVRNHPLVQQSVNAAPLLVRKGVAYTKLAVTLIGRREGQREEALLHLGTDSGELHQVAVLGENATLLREIPLFEATEPVNNILLYQGWLVVGSPLSLARIQAQECALYLSCELCTRFRQLGCEWDVGKEGCVRSAAALDHGVKTEEAVRKCDYQEERCSPPIKELRVSLGLRVVLPCAQLSPRPCSWEHPRNSLTKQRHPDLEVTVTKDGLGSYICACQEGQKREHTPCRRAAYHLTLEDPGTAGALSGCTRHVVAFYVLVFFAGSLCGAMLFHFASGRCKVMRRDSLDSAPLQPGSRLTDERNEIAAAEASRVRKRGNGGCLGDGLSAPPAGDKGRNASASYANYSILSADVPDRPTAPGEGEGSEGGRAESSD